MHSHGALYQSVNSGESFTPIKTLADFFMVAMATAPGDGNIMAVGLDVGSINEPSLAYITDLRAGTAATWNIREITSAPRLAISGVAINPKDPQMVVVVFSGFSGINPVNRTKHVFMTSDSGTTWDDISGTDGGDPLDNLPDLPVYSVVINPNTSPPTIIVANDAGVLQTADHGKTWQRLGEGLPMVTIKGLALDAEARPPVLRVGTYGRSAFELVGLSDLSVSITGTQDPGLPGAPITYTISVANNGPLTARHVVVRTELPDVVVDSAVAKSAPDSDGVIQLDNIVSVLYNALGAQESKTITISAPTDCSEGSGPVIANASVSSETPDPNGGNNGRSAALPSLCP